MRRLLLNLTLILTAILCGKHSIQAKTPETNSDQNIRFSETNILVGSSKSESWFIELSGAANANLSGWMLVIRDATTYVVELEANLTKAFDEDGLCTLDNEDLHFKNSTYKLSGILLLLSSNESNANHLTRDDVVDYILYATSEESVFHPNVEKLFLAEDESKLILSSESLKVEGNNSLSRCNDSVGSFVFVPATPNAPNKCDLNFNDTVEMKLTSTGNKCESSTLPGSDELKTILANQIITGVNRKRQCGLSPFMMPGSSITAKCYNETSDDVLLKWSIHAAFDEQIKAIMDGYKSFVEDTEKLTLNDTDYDVANCTEDCIPSPVHGVKFSETNILIETAGNNSSFIELSGPANGELFGLTLIIRDATKNLTDTTGILLEKTLTGKINQNGLRTLKKDYLGDLNTNKLLGILLLISSDERKTKTLTQDGVVDYCLYANSAKPAFHPDVEKLFLAEDESKLILTSESLKVEGNNSLSRCNDSVESFVFVPATPNAPNKCELNFNDTVEMKLTSTGNKCESSKLPGSDELKTILANQIITGVNLKRQCGLSPFMMPGSSITAKCYNDTSDDVLLKWSIHAAFDEQIKAIMDGYKSFVEDTEKLTLKDNDYDVANCTEDCIPSPVHGVKFSETNILIETAGNNSSFIELSGPANGELFGLTLIIRDATKNTTDILMEKKLSGKINANGLRTLKKDDLGNLNTDKLSGILLLISSDERKAKTLTQDGVVDYCLYAISAEPAFHPDVEKLFLTKDETKLILSPDSLKVEGNNSLSRCNDSVGSFVFVPATPNAPNKCELNFKDTVEMKLTSPGNKCESSKLPGSDELKMILANQIITGVNLKHQCGLSPLMMPGSSITAKCYNEISDDILLKWSIHAAFDEQIKAIMDGYKSFVEETKNLTLNDTVYDVASCTEDCIPSPAKGVKFSETNILIGNNPWFIELSGPANGELYSLTLVIRDATNNATDVLWAKKLSEKLNGDGLITITLKKEDLGFPRTDILSGILLLLSSNESKAETLSKDGVVDYFLYAISAESAFQPDIKELFSTGDESELILSSESIKVEGNNSLSRCKDSVESFVFVPATPNAPNKCDLNFNDTVEMKLTSPGDKCESSKLPGSDELKTILANQIITGVNQKRQCGLSPFMMPGSSITAKCYNETSDEVLLKWSIHAAFDEQIKAIMDGYKSFVEETNNLTLKDTLYDVANCTGDCIPSPAQGVKFSETNILIDTTGRSSWFIELSGPANRDLYGLTLVIRDATKNATDVLLEKKLSGKLNGNGLMTLNKDNLGSWKTDNLTGILLILFSDQNKAKLLTLESVLDHCLYSISTEPAFHPAVEELFLPNHESRLILSSESFKMKGANSLSKCKSRAKSFVFVPATPNFLNKCELDYTDIVEMKLSLRGKKCQSFPLLTSTELKITLANNIITEINMERQCGLSPFMMPGSSIAAKCQDKNSEDILLEWSIHAAFNEQIKAIVEGYKSFVRGKNMLTLDHQKYELANCTESCAKDSPLPNKDRDNEKMKVTVAVVMSCIGVFLIVLLFVVIYMKRKRRGILQFRMTRLNEEDEDDLLEDDFIGNQGPTFMSSR